MSGTRQRCVDLDAPVVDSRGCYPGLVLLRRWETLAESVDVVPHGDDVLPVVLDIGVPVRGAFLGQRAATLTVGYGEHVDEPPTGFVLGLTTDYLAEPLQGSWVTPQRSQHGCVDVLLGIDVRADGQALQRAEVDALEVAVVGDLLHSRIKQSGNSGDFLMPIRGVDLASADAP